MTTKPRHSFPGCKHNKAYFFRGLLAVEKILGSMKASSKIDCRGLTGLVREVLGVPLSVRRVS